MSVGKEWVLAWVPMGKDVDVHVGVSGGAGLEGGVSIGTWVGKEGCWDGFWQGGS